MTDDYGRQVRNQLAQAQAELAEARSWARHGYEIGQRHCGWTDHGVAPAWLTEGWPPHIDNCQHQAALAAAEARIAELTAVLQPTEDALTRVLRLAETLPTEVADRIRAAIDGPAEQSTCCVCGTTEHDGREFYENYQGKLFCPPCADGDRLCDCHQPPLRASQHHPDVKDQIRRQLAALQHQLALMDPDACPRECAEGHTYQQPCAIARPSNSGGPS